MGDTVLVKKKRRKNIVCTAQGDSACEEHKIKMNEVMTWNLKVRLGDMVSVYECANV